MREDAGQRDHPLRRLLNGLRHVVRTGVAWRVVPHGLLPWGAAHGQTMRWMQAGRSHALARDAAPEPVGGLDLRAVLRMASERAAAIQTFKMVLRPLTPCYAASMPTSGTSWRSSTLR